MWKTVRLFSKVSLCNSTCRKPFFRKYLTNAFASNDAWNKRLESPYLKKINVSDMFYEIDNQFLHFGKANGLDIDLFANAITDDTHLDEIEDVIHKLRLSTEAANLLPSTQHAFIRLMLLYGDANELLRVLDDRLNYGIFMDDYCCILLMDKFLKERNFKNAARTSTIQMLQEDFSHPVIKYMSLFACHNFILNPVSWISNESAPEVVNESNPELDEDDEIRLRVRFIRNDYFDDHFDLRNPLSLVGKTLWMIGNEIPDSVGRSYSLIGYTLHEKWDELKKVINMLLESRDNEVVFKESISIARNLVTQESTTDDEGKQTKSTTEHKKDILALLDQLDKSNLVSEKELLKVTEDRMKTAIEECGTETLNKQMQIYSSWEKERERLINEHIEKVKRDKAISEIEAAKQKLKEQEEELFFFENEDKLDVIIENKRVIYPKKWLGKKKPVRAVDKEYVSPEIQKKRREN